jgi:membrane associated rhomboid family serine protease
MMESFARRTAKSVESRVFQRPPGVVFAGLWPHERLRHPERACIIPLSDGVPARRFPLVNVALIVANFAVFLFYELPNPDAAINQASLYPCDVDNACHIGLPWSVGWITAMFLHAGWDHILGNMLFLAIFGKNVEDAFGRLGYVVLYFAGQGQRCASGPQGALTLLPNRLSTYTFVS